MDSTTETAVRQLTLLNALDEEWFKLLTAAMREVGPAAQTLAGLLKLTSKETFVSAARIAGYARLPVKTVRNQLDVLVDHGWITNAGRQRTRAGAPRRTCTIRITKKTHDAGSDFGVLPWWACCVPGKGGRLSWSAKAVLSVVLARLMAVRKAALENGCDDDAKELWDELANMGDDGRWRFKLDTLTYTTGLTRESVVAAKKELSARKMIVWGGGKREDGGNGVDSLSPNPAFVTKIRPAKEGRCYVDFGIADWWK